MSERIEKLKLDMHAKLSHLQERLDSVKTRVKAKNLETQAAVQEQLAKLKAANADQKEKFEGAKQRLRDGLEAKQAETEQKIAEWKAARELTKLTKRADRAEEYAFDAIYVAAIALDEADCATLEAIEARIIADEAAGA